MGNKQGWLNKRSGWNMNRPSNFGDFEQANLSEDLKLKIEDIRGDLEDYGLGHVSVDVQPSDDGIKLLFTISDSSENTGRDTSYVM